MKDRWRCHLCDLKHNKHGNGRLQNHYNKYGKDDLCFSLLLECRKENLLKEEQYFIDNYNPYFNICRIAGNTLGVKRNDDFKKKISERVKNNKYRLGKKHTLETLLKMSEIRKGKKRSEETKLKISLSHKGIKQTEESRAKLRISHLGIKFSKERKKVMSDAHKGYRHSLDAKENMKKAWIKRKQIAI